MESGSILVIDLKPLLFGVDVQLKESFFFNIYLVENSQKFISFQNVFLLRTFERRFLFLMLTQHFTAYFFTPMRRYLYLYI